MTAVRERACGSWESPLAASAVAGHVLRLSYPRITDDGSIYWIEGRPTEAGRSVLVQRRPDGATVDLTPAPLNVRSRVHEYGGLPYAVSSEGHVYFVDFGDQRLWHAAPGTAPRPLPGSAAHTGWRFADLIVDEARARLIAIGEHHGDDGREVQNDIVAVDLRDGHVDVLVRGADFHASPVLSPDGKQLAWLSWNHPHMPWDASALFIATLDEAGRPGPATHVAGDHRASAFVPAFAADGSLYFAWEPNGYWNLHRSADGQITPVLPAPMEAEVGSPLWGAGASYWGFTGPHTIVGAQVRQGIWELFQLDLIARVPTRIPSDLTHVGHLATGPDGFVTLEGNPTQGTMIKRHRLPGARAEKPGAGPEVLQVSTPQLIDAAYVSQPEAIEFPTQGGQSAHGFFYPPRNRDFVPRPGELPPLVVIVHGGPTSATAMMFSPVVQFWTTRGFAVVDVNYRGSSGYGRAYRDSLYGQWGGFDIDDCVAAAAFLAASRRVDGRRLAIRGGSAGGYTTLAALTFRDVFTAGASYYGVSDLQALGRDTHKFESRYIDRLVGVTPGDNPTRAAERYAARSPIHHADRLRCPVIFFQGLEDKVVPPSQAEAMVAALQRNGLQAAYHAFAGEQHGFRKAETIETCLRAELEFYGRAFGFSSTPP